MLRGSVTAGQSGPLFVVSGEVDLTNAEQLSELVTGQLADGTLHLTVDAAGLDFADTAAIRALLLAGRTLRQRGGDLVLLRPQRALARVLEIIGADGPRDPGRNRARAMILGPADAGVAVTVFLLTWVIPGQQCGTAPMRSGGLPRI